MKVESNEVAPSKSFRNSGQHCLTRAGSSAVLLSENQYPLLRRKPQLGAGNLSSTLITFTPTPHKHSQTSNAQPPQSPLAHPQLSASASSLPSNQPTPHT